MNATAGHRSGEGDVGEAALVIRGMMCGSCAAAVTAVLQRQPGVVEAGINFAADAATVRWDRSVTTLGALQEAIRRLGYDARPMDETDGSARDSGLERQLQIRLAVAVCFGMWSMMAAILIYLGPLTPVEPEARWPLALASGVLALPALTYSAYPFYVAGWRTLRAGVPGMDTLITLAVAAAVPVSVWQLARGSDIVYFDVVVMLVTFQLVARLVDIRVRRQAGRSVQSYLRAVPEQARRVNTEGDNRETVPVTAIGLNEWVGVGRGERIPVDGIVQRGRAWVDQTMLTGESALATVSPGDPVFAGTINTEGDLVLRTTAVAGKRRIDGLARSVRQLLSHKSALQRLTDLMARLLLPTAVIAALLAAAVAVASGTDAAEAVRRALAVLVITCPCALSLAVPLIAVLAVGQAGRLGILLRDPAVLETAARATTVLFDKTGTLTQRRPRVATIEPVTGVSQESLLYLAAEATTESDHPLAVGLRAEFPKAGTVPGTRHSHTGDGVAWVGPQGHVLVGRARWLEAEGVAIPALANRSTEVCVARDGVYLGRIRFTEQLAAGAAHTIARLQGAGYRIHLLSGDTWPACIRIAEELGIPPDRVHAEHSPEEKLAAIEGAQTEERVVYVGDGQNDGPALAAAELGIAIGDAEPTARAAAAMILPGGLHPISQALWVARRARRGMIQNLGWAVTYNLIALPGALLGYVHPTIAAVAMGASTLCVLLNSSRFALPPGREGGETPANPPDPDGSSQTRRKSTTTQSASQLTYSADKASP